MHMHGVAWGCMGLQPWESARSCEVACRGARGVDSSRGRIELGLYLHRELGLLIDELSQLPRAHLPLQLPRAACQLAHHACVELPL